ncbi:hypothetical protein [Streptomyces lavendulae]|uniref:hypothetical protein n=1 Tax=Streptomyces lavendulae TaxID=1914 RepID=UPI0031E6B3DB
MTDRPRITPNPDGDGVILHLPNIAYLDTQAWSVDIGLTHAGLAALRAALAPGIGQAPEPVDRPRQFAEVKGREYWRPIHDKYHSANIPVPGCLWCQEASHP